MTEADRSPNQHPEILFVCVHNAGRSQMAASLLNVLSDGRATAMSAGTMPAEHVHPEVVDVMREIGLDLGDATPQVVTEEMLEGADRVITMGCNVDDACPGAIFDAEDWGLPDPKGLPAAEVREIRDTIRARVLVLLEELGIPVPEEAAVFGFLTRA